MTSSFDLEAPDHFVPGAVGKPGSRLFCLQAREHAEVVTLKVEKQQVAALCDYLAGILEDLPVSEEPVPTDLDLIEPIDVQWAVGTLAVAYDDTADRIHVVAEQLMARSDDDPPIVTPATARFRLTRTQVKAFVERGRLLVRSGRPPCPLCGEPVDPTGHVCPRSNGHGRAHGTDG